MTESNRRCVYIDEDTDARLKALGGRNRAENIRRAVALAEVAEELVDVLCIADYTNRQSESDFFDRREAVLDKYREIKND